MSQRTLRQNRALHKWFSMLAETLNDAGLDQKKVLKPSVAIPWDRNSIKNQLFRPIMKAQIGKVSTTDLTTKEINLIYETLIRHLGEKFGIDQDFPSIETIMMNLRTK